ncbi:MAG: hypothetical protein KGJ05_01280 [Alphaproteobacteria bacterium]|nr:hypothetical protein [Alphaproteobacteria bacterium]
MRPFTVLVADDDGTSRGAAAFDRDSLRRIVAKADIAIINAWALHPPVYSLAAGLAVALRQSVIIVETRLAHEQEWIDFLHARNREIQFSIITPVGGSA